MLETLIVDDDHRGEWCTLVSITEFQTTTDETDVRFVIDVVVEIRCVRSCGDEHDDERTLLRFVVAFLDPRCDCPAVWRIAKDAITTPVLFQPVFLFGEEYRAFGIVGSGARIKVEVELIVQLVEEVLRRRLQVGRAAEYSLCQSAWS